MQNTAIANNPQNATFHIFGHGSGYKKWSRAICSAFLFLEYELLNVADPKKPNIAP